MAQKMAQKQGETVVLRKSDVRPTVMHTWICPICGYTVAEFSPARALSSAKLHLERKHYLNVVVEEEEK